MKISQTGVDLIKRWEGIRLKAYIPVPGDKPTIGYGSTGRHVKMGDVITRERAQELLLKDLVRFEACVNRQVKVRITHNQYDACVCFAFNLGCTAFRTSTLLKRINARRFQEAADQFPRWNKVDGKVVRGLTNRRNSERDLFLKAAA